MNAVLFDLDGTLLDTREMILASFRYAYTAVMGAGVRPPEERLLSMVGIPLDEQMALLAPAEHAAEICARYRVHNKQVQKELLGGFAGMAAALEQLLERNIRLAVVTSKRHEQAVSGLEQEGLARYFEFVLGSDDTAEHKPKPGPLLDAAVRMNLSPASCTYVGDSPFDMQAALAANMRAVGVLWGMFAEEDLRTAGAQLIVPAVSELPAALLA